MSTAHRKAKSEASTLSYIDRLHASSPHDVVKIRGSMQHGEELKYVTVEFDPRKYPKIELIHITDVQFGHLACNVRRFIEYRDWILSEPYRFVLFGGDMVDAATAISIASPYENTEEPQGQVYRFAELAMPMRHRVIGYVGGNHERRGVKTFGDLGRLIAMLMKIPYSSGKQFIDVHYGKHKPFKVSLWHGGGAARTAGAKMMMLKRFMEQADSQAYFVGHLHDVLIKYDWRESRKDGEIRLEKIAGIMSSSFLEFYGTYAEVAGLSPSDTMMARLILTPDGKCELTLK